MEQMIPGEIVLWDIAFYWIISVAVFGIMDLYAGKKLGGKRTPGYRILRMPKFISLMAVSVISIVLGVICMRGIEIKASAMTFVGVPYFSMWFFYIVVVFRRVRAERSARSAQSQDPHL